MKRIAIIFEFGTLYGGEHSMLAVIDRLAGQWFEFVAIAPQHGRLADAIRQRSIRHVPLQLHDARGERLSRNAARNSLVDAIARCSPDVVHANSLSMSRLTGAIADEMAIPCIAHLRDIIKLTKAAINDLNSNRLLIAVSQATRNFHVEQGLDAAKTLVRYNGVDCDRYHLRPPTGWLKREFNLPNDCFLAATIGQIGLRKGQDVLAEAAVLAAEHLPDNCYLLVGERNSTKRESVDFEANVVACFQHAGLDKNFRCLGFREDIPRLMNEVDLLIHPSHQEPFGRVLLEAAASELPILATDVGGTTEILQDGDSARLVPPGNAQALADALIDLHSNPSMRTQFARKARSCVQLTFNIDQAVRELVDVWSQTAGSDTNQLCFSD